jgi:hypothetical protein
VLFASALVAVVVCAALWGVASRRGRSTIHARAAAAALLEFHGQFTTNGNRLVSRDRWPASLKALKINGVEVNSFRARAWKKEFGPLGIWWAAGYQVQRQHTNDNVWTLYRVSSFGGPGMNEGFHWRGLVTSVTNAP